jgi:alanine-synthesizing transaminase
MVVMGGSIRALPVVVACFEFEFMGGSMGSVVGERFARGAQTALEQKVPFICFTATGGARMQEGLLSLFQMAKTTAMIAKLAEVAAKPDAHGDSASKGIAGLRRAQSAYYDRRFGVDLDPETEVVVTLGSKEGLANLAQAITAPGDVVLAPNPSYPIHTFGFIIAGATIRSVPTTPDEKYFEALERAVRFTVPRPSVLVMGYPSNPTAEVADLAFYERVVAFAKKHNIWVLSDLAYSEIYFDGVPTPSILQVPGAKDVAIEFTSMSKTYSMAGWRIGFAVGNKTLISALTRVKSYLDYGAFTPIQAAAVAACGVCRHSWSRS